MESGQQFWILWVLGAVKSCLEMGHQMRWVRRVCRTEAACTGEVYMCRHKKVGTGTFCSCSRGGWGQCRVCIDNGS